jgi:pimeloyl-ACP methyl ester carboxylesterase
MKPPARPHMTPEIAKGYQPVRTPRLTRKSQQQHPCPAMRRPTVGRIAVLTALGLLAAITLAITGFRIAASVRETNTAEALAPPGGRFVETPGGRMFLQDDGPRDGIPVVLIHGTAAWSEFWRGTIDHLTAQRYRVIAIDLPPFGFSQRPATAAYSRADQAQRIVGVLDALGIDRAILVGHSFGAGATVETVMHHPSRVRGLVLIAAALGLPGGDEAPSPPSPAVMKFLDLPVLPDALIATTATNPLLTRKLLGTMISRKEAATEELASILRWPMTLHGTTRLCSMGEIIPDARSQGTQHEAAKLRADRHSHPSDLGRSRHPDTARARVTPVQPDTRRKT